MDAKVRERIQMKLGYDFYTILYMNTPLQCDTGEL